MPSPWKADEEDRARLDQGRKLPALARVIATWGLAVASERAGDVAGSESLIAELREAAPHSAPLLLIPPRNV